MAILGLLHVKHYQDNETREKKISMVRNNYEKVGFTGKF